MKQIISFSRRTDGPAFHMDKLERAIARKSITVQNPVNRKFYQVSLSPSDVAGFVFWSKNFKPLLDKWHLLEPYISKSTTLVGKPSPPSVFFQFTRNTSHPLLEPGVPSLEHSFQVLEELLELVPPDLVMWRFDPIVFWEREGTIMSNVKGFREIAMRFSEAGVKCCTFSFATYYKKVKQRMKRHDFPFHEPNQEEIQGTVAFMLDVARDLGLELRACCNPRLLSIPGVFKASCIDGEFLGKAWGQRVSKARDHGQREACGCTKSRDIGGYNPSWKCKAGCLYCYANS